ncbi:uncharacterized protein LOC105737381 [Apis florea]|uniref:uncharacterized protein LOC105737381 n=1 Tax=Apis florea TaxID=7463 RepID=UPI0006298D69|nr:uncharacterized protein LOC105737381 [Apis florea]
MVTQMKDFNVSSESSGMFTYVRNTGTHLSTLTRILGVCTAVGIFLNQRHERARSSDRRITHTSISPRKEASTAIRSPVLNYSCKWHRCLNYHALSALLRDAFGRSGVPG